MLELVLALALATTLVFGTLGLARELAPALGLAFGLGLELAIGPVIVLRSGRTL